METKRITGEVIGAAVAVHRRLGPGLLESAYEACLSVELLRRGKTRPQPSPDPRVPPARLFEYEWPQPSPDPRVPAVRL